jgi:hypothetical protein
MVTAFCCVCGAERELPFGEVVERWCSEPCEAEFLRGVSLLESGGDLAEVGVDLWSRLGCSIVDEVKRRRRAERIYVRDQREAEYVRNKPRPMRPLYPV